ncbi:hypothetical protein C2W62_23290 [Candidatus Entotheonella serta]|nr:hypothetical protein C2W62_23290 [Candidatus Entotheonella serta]
MSHLLEPPTEPVRLILDTDTANEIDDQFALAWTLLSPGQLEIEGITAEPFSFQHHRPKLLQAHRIVTAGGPSTPTEAALVSTYRSWLDGLASLGKDPAEVNFVPPDESMDLSYQEILTIYDKLELDSGGCVYRGATGYLTSFDAPLRTPAAEHIVERALAASDRPLYVAGIGCATNIASALLIAPEITRNLIVVWTSGYPSSCHLNKTTLHHSIWYKTHSRRNCFSNAASPTSICRAFTLAHNSKSPCRTWRLGCEAKGRLATISTISTRTTPSTNSAASSTIAGAPGSCGT